MVGRFVASTIYEGYLSEGLADMHITVSLAERDASNAMMANPLAFVAPNLNGSVDTHRMLTTTRFRLVPLRLKTKEITLGHNRTPGIRGLV